MDKRQGQQRLDARPSGRSLRLTFRVSDGKVQLEKVEQVNIICPPSVGERPQAGKHGDFWLELRGARERVIFHRLLHNPLGDSVEVHSPEGKIERIFGPVTESVFEALVPDDPEARSIVLMGEYLDASERDSKRAQGSRELARFDLPGTTRGGETGKQRGQR